MNVLARFAISAPDPRGSPHPACHPRVVSATI
jgi:hypothetical protein